MNKYRKICGKMLHETINFTPDRRVNPYNYVHVQLNQNYVSPEDYARMSQEIVEQSLQEK